MALKRFSAPAAEPITLGEAKNHLRIDTNDDDSLIENYIKTARELIDGSEGWLGRALVYQTYDFTLNCFPWAILIPLPPLASVTSVKYIDTNGDEITLATSQYRVVDNGNWPSIIEPAFQVVWPVTRKITAAVTIRFICGYADGAANPLVLTDIPATIRTAMLQTIAHWYENRESVLVSTSARVAATELPIATQDLLELYRVHTFA